MAEQHSKRLGGLDALRGLAAAAVMLYHYTAWYPFLTGSKLPISAPYGIFGVELFFVISGFVIFMTLERTPSLAEFIAARVARLYPAFLASMLATLWLTAESLRPDQLFANLTMVPLALGQMPYDGSYWSLRFELEFYVLAALCVLVLHWRNPELPCTGWLAAEFLLRAFFGATPRQPLMDISPTRRSHICSSSASCSTACTAAMRPA